MDDAFAGIALGALVSGGMALTVSARAEAARPADLRE
jgi:hypothetical protein